MAAAGDSPEILLEAARRIGPVIRGHADEAERERRLSPATFDALAGADLFRMFTPRSLGGLEVDPVTCLRVIEQVSLFDSAAGWTLMVASAAPFFGARLPDSTAKEFFGSGPRTLVAVALNPPLQATPADGGYRITGRSRFASNCREASWFGFPAIVVEDGRPRARDDGVEEQIFAYLPAEQCEIVETWSVLGMRGTGSDDVAVSDVFVPVARTFPNIPGIEPNAYYSGPLYRLPTITLAAVLSPPVALANARNAIDELVAIARAKKPFASTALLRERALCQTQLAQAEAAQRSARALLIDTVREAWERTVAGETATLEQKGDLLLAAANAVSGATRAVELVYRAAGTTGIYERSPLERYFRDAQVLRHHAFVSESRYATVGQIYLGLPPDFALDTL